MLRRRASGGRRSPVGAGRGSRGRNPPAARMAARSLSSLDAPARRSRSRNRPLELTLEPRVALCSVALCGRVACAVSRSVPWMEQRACMVSVRSRRELFTAVCTTHALSYTACGPPTTNRTHNADRSTSWCCKLGIMRCRRRAARARADMRARGSCSMLRAHADCLDRCRDLKRWGGEPTCRRRSGGPRASPCCSDWPAGPTCCRRAAGTRSRSAASGRRPRWRAHRHPWC